MKKEVNWVAAGKRGLQLRTKKCYDIRHRKGRRSESQETAWMLLGIACEGEGQHQKDLKGVPHQKRKRATK